MHYWLFGKRYTVQSCPWVQFLQPNPTQPAKWLTAFTLKPNPTHQMTDTTQPNPSQSNNFRPTNQPNPQPITQSNSIGLQPSSNLRAQGKQFFTVSKSLSGTNHLSGYQALLQQSQEAYRVLEFLEMFLTHNSTQPTKKLKISTQPNPTRRSTQLMDNSDTVILHKIHIGILM